MTGDYTFGMVCMLVGMLSLYLLPTIIAVVRESRHAILVFVINFFGGWSVVGWVVSLGIALAP